MVSDNKVQIGVAKAPGKRGAFIDRANRFGVSLLVVEMAVVVAVDPPWFHRIVTGIGKFPRVSLGRLDNDLSEHFLSEVSSEGTWRVPRIASTHRWSKEVGCNGRSDAEPTTDDIL